MSSAAPAVKPDERNAGQADAGAPGAKPGGWRAHWPWVKRLLALVFFVGVGVLLFSHARTIDWGEVWETLKRYPAQTLLMAAGLAGASHLLYSTYDLIGRQQTGHGLARRKVMSIAFVSYVFNLNLGSLVGGVAFRLRLYSRFGLDTGVITRVLGISVFTNWLGYMALAGGVFALRAVEVPAAWKISGGALQWVGFGLIGLVLAYLLACAASSRRSWTLRGHDFTLPTARVALVQWLLSSVNWMLIAAVVWVLISQKVAYGTVVAVLMVAAIAGVITHIPAGLGVLETVFITLLGSQLPHGQLLAALLAYRALYYLAPLLLAAPLYFMLEAGARGNRDAARSDGSGDDAGGGPGDGQTGWRKIERPLGRDGQNRGKPRPAAELKR